MKYTRIITTKIAIPKNLTQETGSSAFSISVFLHFCGFLWLKFSANVYIFKAIAWQCKHWLRISVEENYWNAEKPMYWKQMRLFHSASVPHCCSQCERQNSELRKWLKISWPICFAYNLLTTTMHLALQKAGMWRESEKISE